MLLLINIYILTTRKSTLLEIGFSKITPVYVMMRCVVTITTQVKPCINIIFKEHSKINDRLFLKKDVTEILLYGFVTENVKTRWG